MTMPPADSPTDTDRPVQGWSVFDLTSLSSPSPLAAGLTIALSVLVALSIAIVGLVVLGQFLWQAATLPSAGFEDTSKRLLALGVLVAAPFAIWRIIVSHWQARAAQTQARAAMHQADVAREEHYTSLFTSAVSQLGAMREVSDGVSTKTEPNVEARLGAIYALERIAQDSERDHWPIMETLCAYVRNAAGPANSPSSELKEEVVEHFENGDAYKHSPRVDVQAALTVIGRRKAERLQHEALLRSTALGSMSYRLDLRRTNLAKVVLDGLHFDHATFDESDLSFASLQRTSLIGASFAGVSAVGGDFMGAQMANAKLSGEWQGAHFRSTDLRNLPNGYYQKFNVDGAIFADADLSGSTLSRWSMVRTSFPRANLERATFRSGVIVGTTFMNANLENAIFETPIWQAVYLSGAKLIGAVGLNQDYINGSFGSSETYLPAGLSRPASWLPAGASKEEIQGYRTIYFKERTAALSHWRDKQKRNELDDDIPF